MAKENNQFGIDYAYPGICSLCHTEIAEFSGSHSNGIPIITKMKPNYRRAVIILSDNSSMGVSLCKDCYDLKPSDMQALMESEINGWEHEVSNYLKDKWDENRKKNYMDRVSKLFIINRADKPIPEDKLSSIKKPRLEKLKYKPKVVREEVVHGLGK